MANLPEVVPVPFKLAVVGVVFCVEPSAEIRAGIEEVVRKALEEELPNVKVSGQFFMYHNTEIIIKPEATNGE